MSYGAVDSQKQLYSVLITPVLLPFMANQLGFSTWVFFLLFFCLSDVRGLISPLERRLVVSSVANGTRYKGLFTDVLGNRQDLRYVVVIFIDDIPIPVLLDTGSTDLWVNVPGFTQFTNTGIPLKLLYGDGSYGVEGTIGLGTFQWGSFGTTQQAFLHATKNTIADVTNLGIFGVLGLAFDFGGASFINAAIQQKYGASSTLGYSVLHHFFNQYPQQPKVVALRLNRYDNPDDTSGGSIAVGEYDPTYSAVTKAPKLPQYPFGGDRWSTLLDGIHVNGKYIPVKSRFPGVPPGRAITLLDTGAPWSVLPVIYRDAIFSNIPGAVKYTQGKTSNWIVPCRSTSIVDFVFGNRSFPIHPLDLTSVTILNLPVGPSPIVPPPVSQVSACFSDSEFTGQDDYGNFPFEILLGDNFLRNVYSAFNFGDSSSNGRPYMQLLSTLDIKKAISQVTSIRGMEMASLPPELPPAELLKHLVGSASAVLPLTTAI